MGPGVARRIDSIVADGDRGNMSSGRSERHARPGHGIVGAAVALLLVSAGWVVPPTAAGQPGAPSAPAEGGTADWRQVSTGSYHTCGIRTSGRLYCWGNDVSGQLGDGGTNTNQPVPTEVAGNATDWVAVDAGDFHTCALKSSGRLLCWGYDGFGQLGDGGTNTERPTPTEVDGHATNWTAVDTGGSHTCARKASGRLLCWGADSSGQLGDGGTNAARSIPTPVAGNATNWSRPTAGGSHTCARKTNGRLFCWGRDAQGQLGDGGTNTDRPTPTQVARNLTNWATVDAGAAHTCARKTTGRLFCWGYDGSGQLGDGGTNTNRPVPTQVAGAGTSWATVATGFAHTCARKTSGRVFCWGADFNGQLGDGGTNTNQPVPTEVAGSATDWATVDAGSSHTCARITTRRLFCWGFDGSGQLGDGGTNTNQPTPVPVAS
jgi:Regulator of chromosome condensation (RCC1) repeat